MLHKPLNPSTKIVWQPIPGSSQEIAINSPCHHILFTGARGPGKTDTQLMYFRRLVGIGYGAFMRGIIFDREYKMLDDLVSKSKRWFYAFEDGSVFLTAKSDYKWVFPTGEELLFRSISDPEEYWNYHGQEFPFIGWNELCKYANSECYDRMLSCNRSSFTEKDWPIDKDGRPISLPPIPLRVFSTTNPYGPGHNWVKRRFITPAPYGRVVSRKMEVFNPQSQKEEVVEKTQVTIFGSYRENIYLPPEYVLELESIQEENVRRAWLLGDWNITAGGAIDDLWKPTVHVKPRFACPAGTYIDRSFDAGSSQPFWVGWWLEANGEDFELEDGTTFTPAPGSLILINEWYGTKEIGTNKGLRLSSEEIAQGILWRERRMMELGWIAEPPQPGPADNSIRNVIDTHFDTIEKVMEDNGVLWEKSDKSRGSRVIGLQLLRDRLKSALTGEGPAIYVMDNCRAWIDILPSLPLDPDKPDDVDTDAEDHPWDGTRFRILKGNERFAKEIDFRFPY
jgi:hypothetical protein